MWFTKFAHMAHVGGEHMDSLLSLATQTCTDRVRTGAKTIMSECSFYHYLCDGLDDRVNLRTPTLKILLYGFIQGWGCGYRSLQSLCSWVVKYREKQSNVASPSSPPLPGKSSGGKEGLTIPTIPKAQSCLVEVGDKPPSFAGSKEWIGCCEASIVLDHLYAVHSSNSN